MSTIPREQFEDLIDRIEHCAGVVAADGLDGSTISGIQRADETVKESRAALLATFDALAARIAELEAEHTKTPAEALPLIVRYRNWKGETRERRIFPVGVRWAANQWHPERKWLLDAVDAETGKTKTFSFDGFLPTNEGNAASRLRIAQQFENEAQREYEASPEYPAGPHPAIAAGNRVLARWAAAAKEGA